MAHELESATSMAYAGQVPWHGLGIKVPSDLTPEQIMQVAGLDWEVRKEKCFTTIDGVQTEVPRQALIRSSDNKILDIVSDDWNPVQNREAFDFFNEYIMAGDMSMETAGSLKGGQIIWGLAKIQSDFELFGGDKVSGYLLFSNFHKYGFSTDVRLTPIRVVCNNTIQLALGSKAERYVKVHHRTKFNPDEVKEVMGISTEKMNKYKELAQFLGSKPAKQENIVEYFKRVFPVTGSKEKDLSRNAKTALDVLHTQPGYQYAEGSWWQPLNAVTYMTDHVLGRSADTRLSSSWYGINKSLKEKAVELAIDYAEAA